MRLRIKGAALHEMVSTGGGWPPATRNRGCGWRSTRARWACGPLALWCRRGGRCLRCSATGRPPRARSVATDTSLQPRDLQACTYYARQRKPCLAAVTTSSAMIDGGRHLPLCCLAFRFNFYVSAHTWCLGSGAAGDASNCSLHSGERLSWSIVYPSQTTIKTDQ
jgi:hypothetical protein